VSTTTDHWYKEGLRFACTRCGNCCGGAPGYVWVDDEEISAMAAYLKLPEAQFRKRHVRKIFARQSLKELKNGDCEFLHRSDDGKAACTIHKVRPIQCRTWPFWKSNLESPEAWKEVGQECPGLNRGKLYSLPVIQEQMHAGASRPL
jgi:Fe-S-cluster containining protein